MRRPVKPERDAAVREMVAGGLTQGEIAKRLLIAPSGVHHITKRLKVQPRDGRGLSRKGTHDQGRADAMAALYTSGQTLQQIGDRFGLSRERVRQVLRKRTAVAARDGGFAIKARWRRAEIATKRDQACMAKLGCGWDEYVRIRELGRTMRRQGRGYQQTPIGAFIRQRLSAHRRGVAWEFTFWGWWSIWQASGRWHQRGRGQGYVMCRRGDEGPYAIGNVFIASAIENTSSAKHKKSGLPTGVRLTKSGRYSAARMIGGRRIKLGTYDSPAQAYAAYVAAAPGFHHRRTPSAHEAASAPSSSPPASRALAPAQAPAEASA